MTDWLDFLRLFGGVVYLVMGGDLLVRGALGFSRRASISPLVVGMTVVALGTSAPELVVSLHSAFSGVSGLSIGNVVGSNISNVFVVLGAPALIYPNPLNADRYVVLNSGFTFREYDYLNNARQVPKLPDWAIVDLRTPPNSRAPGKIVAADFFNESWELASE